MAEELKVNSGEPAAPSEPPVEPVAEPTEPTGEPVAPSEPAPSGEPKVELSEKEKQLQGNQDRAEGKLKEVYKQIIPYFEIDSMGNITGLKQQALPKSLEPDFDQLAEAALITGDKTALQKLLTRVKDDAKREALQGTTEMQSMNREVEALKKDYPMLYTEDGIPDETNPLYQEAQKTLMANPHLAHPLRIRTVIEAAESRLIKRGFPEIEQKIRNDTLSKRKKVGSSITGIPASKPTEPDDLSLLSDEQKAALSREGYDQEGVKRIAKIVKQAQKEGGFILR